MSKKEQTQRMSEVWRQLPGHEKYCASNDGKIRGRVVLKPWVINSGYEAVTLSRNGLQKNYLVHRLVASAFCGAADGTREVNHKDGNKRNNAAINLEWVSAKENSFHAKQAGLLANRDEAVLAQRVPVFCETLNRQFPSMGDAARALGVRQSGISNVIYGRSRSVGGLKFRRVS